MKLKLMPWDKAKEVAIENKYYVADNDSIIMIQEGDIPWGGEIDVTIPLVDLGYYTSDKFNIPSCCFECNINEVVERGEILDKESYVVGNIFRSLFIILYQRHIYLVRFRNSEIVGFKKIGRAI